MLVVYQLVFSTLAGKGSCGGSKAPSDEVFPARVRKLVGGWTGMLDSESHLGRPLSSRQCTV